MASSSNKVPADYPSRKELLKIHVDNNCVKGGFLKAVSAQQEITYRLCKRFQTACKVDVGADAARSKLKRLNKIQEYWFDRVLEDLDKTRKELETVKYELRVRFSHLCDWPTFKGHLFFV